MIIEGAGVCPLVKIGDEVKGLKVIDIICDRIVSGACRAFRAFAMLQLDDPYKEWRFINPTEVVDCDSCPVLAEDPNHLEKTKRLEELMIATGKPRSSLVTSVELPTDKEPEHKEHDRFELIDLTGEEEQ